jgi:two-component system, OmpR family, response regulator CpxR
LPTPYESPIRRGPARPLVLCVEDDDAALILRKAVLEKNGFNVIGATSTEEAIRILREAPVCATIADHMLQGTTGAKMAIQMKKAKPDVPIIMYSATVPEHFNGVDVYINKGEATAEFLRIVHEIVERFCS